MPDELWAPALKDLEDDLIYLRKGRGLTVDRLRDAGTVIKACSGGEGEEPPIETVYERILSALYVLRPTPHGEALWAAFGIDAGSAERVEDRRKAHAKKVKRQPNTVLGWENKAIAELALRLLSRYHGAPPLSKDLPIPHGGYYMPALQVFCLIKDRQFVESVQIRTVVSLVDGADHFVYGTYSPTILSDPVGCALEPPREFPGGYLHKIVFGEALKIGEAHTFSFHENVPPLAEAPEPLKQDFSGQTFESPTKHYRVEVRFEGEKPKVVWGYRQLTRIERPGEPKSGVAIPMTDSGVVSLHVTDLLGGLCSGIAWRWE